MNPKQIQTIIGNEVAKMSPLSGGMIAQVYRVDFIDGQHFAVKVDKSKNDSLNIEAKMLDYLSQNSNLPVPEVIYSDNDLLITRYIENQGGINSSVQEDSAHYLAQLHNISSNKFGLHFDTLIGGLHQPNTQYDSWIDFFAEQRLNYMADVAYKSGQLPLSYRQRIEQLTSTLDNFLYEPDKPSLIHGDMWSGNILAQKDKVVGFIDPAIYYAHDEIELAFSTLFGTFGQIFFDAYINLRPIEPDFFEERRHIYNLYPLLVHVQLFGSSYLPQIDSILKKFSY